MNTQAAIESLDHNRLSVTGWRRSMLWLSLVACLVAPVAARAVAADTQAGLPRRATFPAEVHPGLRVEYGELVPDTGVRLRTIVTRPESATSRLPAILYVQWLSCDTIELRADARDGWSQMLSRVIRESGAVVWRTEKSGVGDSEGIPCASLDYETELAHHRAAFEALRARPDVDPARIVVFGASMGTTMAPLVAAGHPVRGLVTWGGGARSWLERQIAFDRRALDLSGAPLDGVAEQMKEQIEFESLYLSGRTPASIVTERPDLAAASKRVIGLEGDSHYGRPLAFQWQAQRQDWAAAWSRIDAPVLALLGEYDWFEDPRSAELIARIVNRRRAGLGEFRLVHRLDHHFSRFDSAEAAFKDVGGVPDPGPILEIMLPWLRQRFQ
jgi:pimeloyl-ACP methyl ester carboxylesterase